MFFKYTIKISHFNYLYIYKLIMNLVLLINLLLKPLTISVVDLPNNRKFKTILRSPHVFKKSREQFSKLIYNKLIILKFKYDCTEILTQLLKTLNCEYTLNIKYEKYKNIS